MAEGPPLLLTVAVVPLLALGCSFRSDPPPGAGGDMIYELQNCANCHDPDGSGTDRGPALAGLAAHWTAEDLAAYLARPSDFVAADERLASVSGRYGAEMSSYDNLSEAERLVLAQWLLAR